MDTILKDLGKSERRKRGEGGRGREERERDGDAQMEMFLSPLHTQERGGRETIQRLKKRKRGWRREREMLPTAKRGGKKWCGGRRDSLPA